MGFRVLGFGLGLRVLGFFFVFWDFSLCFGIFLCVLGLSLGSWPRVWGIGFWDLALSLGSRDLGFGL